MGGDPGRWWGYIIPPLFVQGGWPIESSPPPPNVAMICVFEERPQVFSNSPPPPHLSKYSQGWIVLEVHFLVVILGEKCLIIAPPPPPPPHLDTNLHHCSNYCQEMGQKWSWVKVAMETEILSLNSALACFCCLSPGHPGATRVQEWRDFSPMQLFQLFFSQAVWELIVSETNRYAEQSLSEKSTSHQSQWTPTTIPEMMAFVALLMCMGINRRPQYNMYWSKWDILHSAIVSSNHVSQPISGNPEFLTSGQQRRSSKK